MNVNNTKSVLVFGCGWLGTKLGKHLISKGFNVFGTTRSSENFSKMREVGIRPIKLDLSTQEFIDVRIPEVSHVVISISPGQNNAQSDYSKVLAKIGTHYSGKDVQVIMYSSTSVYGNAKGDVKEEDALSDSKSENRLLEAEGVLKGLVPNAIILRLCGLYGEDRHPVHSLAGKKGIVNGDAPVNLVHSDDVIQVTAQVIEQGLQAETYNVGSDGHPTRSELYVTLAEKLELKPPKFLAGGDDGRIISSEKMKKILKSGFLHPDPSEY